MVITRSQGDIAEQEERRHTGEELGEGTSHRQNERIRIAREQMERIEKERQRRMSRDPPASPTLVTGDTNSRQRTKSPARSTRSVRSTTSTTTRLRRAELEAAEKLAAIKRQQLELESELVKKRLAVEVSAIQEDAESLHEEQIPPVDTNGRVNDWLFTNPLDENIEKVQEVNRQPTSTRTRSDIEHLAETLEKMSRPSIRCTELPTFSGSPNEWLPFKAAFCDASTLHHISAAENLQRLRACLKGEARDAVAALLYTATGPEVIMKTLEQCFGRPEVIIDRALEDLKKLPRLGSSAMELNNFAVKLQNVTCVLRSIDKRGYLYNPMLAREVIDKLSPHLRSRWCDYADEQQGTSDPEIIVLSRFLMREADRALKYTYAPGTSSHVAVTKKEYRPAPTQKRKANIVYAVNENEERLDACPSCNKDHALQHCHKYKALTIDRRWEFVKENKLCFKCLKRRHRRNLCKAKSCGWNECNRPHHQTLHQEKVDNSQQIGAGRTPNDNGSVLSVVPTTTTTGSRMVLLKMCPVTVSGPRGECETYALLDEGATVTLLDEDLAKKIGAEGPTQPLHLHGVNMSQKERSSKRVTVKLKGKNEESTHTIQARTVKNLKLHRQRIPEALLEYDHLRDLPREQVCYDTVQPGILVGTDHWECIVSRELKMGGPDQPAGTKTLLGWVIHGTAPRSIIYERESVLHVYTPDRAIDTNQQHDERLHELVESYFKIDALGIAQKTHISDNDKRATSIVERTLRKTDSGYEVGLPWKRDNVTMPRNYETALNRLRSIERKMDSSESFAKEYTNQMDNLMIKGYAEPCDGSEELSPVCWYLPHFAVKNPNKPGKVRLVFDAAAKSRGVCLNDQLLEGPDLLSSLQGIVFRFRERPIAVTADIQEMFLRVKIRPQDQPAQQFLWRGMDRTQAPARYKMTSMIFGAASSPFMAHYVRDHNARLHAETHPLALEAITKNHYMDDLVASYEDKYQARRAVKEVKEVHTAAGFTLRGWSSNETDVLQEVPTDLRATTPAQLGKENQENKILGLYWNAEKDELGFNTSMNRVPADVRAQIRAPTKREALSAVMSIYDPLGLLSHYTIRAKIILQSLWRLQIPWDEPIPAEEGELFADWLQQLDEISRLRLNRCYTVKSYERIELHVICDASEQAYATVAYWRITHYDGKISVVLVAAKAKVAPRRTQTIPRLELQAAVIGARLADTIKREHRIVVTRTIYWTDSSTVVHWVRNDARRYTPFVAHRLSEIAELTNKEEWRWLPTAENVADDATRFTRSPIERGERWFQGPSFLYMPEEQWPTEQECEEEEPEVLHTCEAEKTKNEWLPDPARFSKFETLVRAAARVLAFIDICRRKEESLELKHIEEAERALIRRAQEDSFAEELNRITKARPLPRASRIFKLDPVLEEGVLRVRGRIGAASAPTEVKRPIILDGRHHIAKLIVSRAHCAAGHANRERVINDLRQRYWIIHLRPAVRAIEYRCTLCRVRRARPKVPVTGDLPRARLEPFTRPFTNCGIDLFGPMIVKIGRRREKRWGALFTCLTSRAVHIELVASLSTDSAIMALRRMAARRGWPRLMYSDNATNFRGADKELRAAYNEWLPILREEALKHRMEWRYIPPGAPNQGGAWERLVRSVKTALSATLNEKVPSEEVLSTLLAEAEFSVNARPLTHVSVSPSDPEALTPNHFLLGTSEGLPTMGPCNDADRRAWRASQALADHFWQRWLKEYLPTLVPRGESANTTRRLRVGDIVVVVDHTLPRNVWPMGKIEKTYEGPDGGVRVVDVRTRTGVFRRPTSKLVVLIEEEEATQAAPGGELLRTHADL